MKKKVVPKFNVGDVVYELVHGKIETLEVQDIRFEYILKNQNYQHVTSSGYNLFKSKAELLKSLE